MGCEQDGGPLCGQCPEYCRYSARAEQQAIHDEWIADRKNKLLTEGIIEIWDGEVVLTELGEHAVHAGTGHVRNEVDELFPRLIHGDVVIDPADWIKLPVLPAPEDQPF